MTEKSGGSVLLISMITDLSTSRNSILNRRCVRMVWCTDVR